MYLHCTSEAYFKYAFQISWPTLWVEFSCLNAAESQLGHIFNYKECFWVDRYIHWTHKGATMVGINQLNSLIFVPPDVKKMHLLALSVLRFLCKTFSKLLKFTLWNSFLCRWLLKNSNIQIKNLCGSKHVRAAKGSELMRCMK